MDIVRSNKTKKFPTKKQLVALAVGLSVGSLLFLFGHSNASYLADTDSLLIAEVNRGELQIEVRGTGVLVPKDIRWITTTVPGRVERVHRKAGAQVVQGDLLLELSNPQLQQELAEARWELQAMEAEHKARVVALESELLDQEIAVINEKLNHERSQLTLDAQQELFDQGIVAISKIDYQEVKINVSQFKQRWQLEQMRLQKRRDNLAAQIEAGEARLQRMRKSLERITQQVASLQVRASMDSIVQEMPLQLGQQVHSGSNLALLARSGHFVAELRIPEQQIKDVRIGQKASLDTRSSVLAGEVSRIDPAVSNNSVLVEVELLGDLPQEARPELTVDGRIEVITIPDTLYVKRPMFARSFSPFQVYRLDAAGGIASVQEVSFGHMSSQYIEVASGLAEGERIIVSDVAAWQRHQQIRLN